MKNKWWVAGGEGNQKNQLQSASLSYLESAIWSSNSILGAFTQKLRKANIRLVMSVRPSDSPPSHMKQFGSRWKDFHEI